MFEGFKGHSEYNKARPHAAMLHTCDFAFEGCCDA